MMKQVINWTFGGFFRTIGRTLAFIVIGIAIAYIFSVADFKLPNIFRFALTQVNASEITNHWLGEVVSPTNTWNYASINPIYVSRDLDTYTTYQQEVVFENSLNSTGINQVYINGYVKGVDLSINDYECSSVESSGTFTYCEYTEYLNNLDLQIWFGNATRQCKMTWNNIPINSVGSDKYLFWQAECFLEDYQNIGNISYRINAKDWRTHVHSFEFGINRNLFFSKSDSQAIINNQTQNTQAIINNQNQNYNDTNTTHESNETVNFFTSYQDNTPTALTAVVSAPLDIFNKLLTGVSSPLCFTLKSKEVCIPNGVMIWNKSTRTSFVIDNKVVTPHPFNSDASLNVSPLVQLFNLVAGGYLCYKMLISLFRIVEENILNPTNSRVEVMKL